jgi:hypothetical protein
VGLTILVHEERKRNVTYFHNSTTARNNPINRKRHLRNVGVSDDSVYAKTETVLLPDTSSEHISSWQSATIEAFRGAEFAVPGSRKYIEIYSSSVAVTR